MAIYRTMEWSEDVKVGISQEEKSKLGFQVNEILTGLQRIRCHVYPDNCYILIL